MVFVLLQINISCLFWLIPFFHRSHLSLAILFWKVNIMRTGFKYLTNRGTMCLRLWPYNANKTVLFNQQVTRNQTGLLARYTIIWLLFHLDYLIFQEFVSCPLGDSLGLSFQYHFLPFKVMTRECIRNFPFKSQFVSTII